MSREPGAGLGRAALGRPRPRVRGARRRAAPGPAARGVLGGAAARLPPGARPVPGRESEWEEGLRPRPPPEPRAPQPVLVVPLPGRGSWDPRPGHHFTRSQKPGSGSGRVPEASGGCRLPPASVFSPLLGSVVVLWRLSLQIVCKSYHPSQSSFQILFGLKEQRNRLCLGGELAGRLGHMLISEALQEFLPSGSFRDLIGFLR